MMSGRREMKNLTPAMRQYMEIKGENPDAILFFRMGDFYEMFFDDAVTASRIMGIALTSRDRDREIPMCGVPYHSARSYIAKLVGEGLKVAVCEQVGDQGQAGGGKGIVRRKVVRVITPGTAVEDELLEPGANNFIAAASVNSRKYGFAYMDLSTGEFLLTELASKEELTDEIRRIRPLELIVERSRQAEFSSTDPSVKKLTPLPEYDFEEGVAAGRMKAHFRTHSLDGFGCSGLPAAVSAAGALLHYIKGTQKTELAHIRKCTPYFPDDYLVLDSTTRRNLEITANLRYATKEGTLLELLDTTSTAMGARRLKSWLLHPLKDASEINRRLDAVEELVEKREAREALASLFKDVYDLERLCARVSLAMAGPRDLAALRNSLEKLPRVAEAACEFTAPMLSELSSNMDPVSEAAYAIGKAVVENPPATVRDGGVIREGFDSALDELREIGSGGKDWIARLEAGERRRTGINSLKVGYNRVFGYYIEVTRTNLQSVPPEYTRKQTLVNAERFVTGELKEWEDRILTAEEKATELEGELFSDLVETLSQYTERIRSTAAVVSTLDALISLARASERNGYAKPEVVEGTEIFIRDGRHPVVEASAAGDFVPNDLSVDGSTSQVLVITGPNMAGKSTYLRQNALIVLMAQIGCFVPAAEARIGVVDRIFTRVGASDDLSRGQSTFMVEMNETANILNNATPGSLVILDEIGRGTSTFDGLSIAWSVVEYIHDHPGLRAKTLFATHYHELTELNLTKERVKNYNMAVKEWNGEVIFLRKVVPGGSSSSYGIQVAKLAGLPDRVIERAGEILRNLEKGELTETGAPRLAAHAKGEEEIKQLSLLGAKDELRERLKTIDIERTTPIEALDLLHKLKMLLDE